jgi:hypothetical protein
MTIGIITKKGLIWGDQGEGEGEKQGYCGVKRIEVYCIYTYEDGVKKPTKQFEKVKKKREWKHSGGGEPVQSTQYSCIELSQ